MSKRHFLAVMLEDVMRKGVVTVVLPIYNVEKYLNRCIKSVVNQSYKDLEIILVDDGSPDNCPELCDRWAQKDSRIKVIHKKNAGLGYARNTGIDNATGEYICFFDSDDYIALDAIEKAVTLAQRSKADVVNFGFCYVNENGMTGKCTIPKMPQSIYEGSDVQDIFLPELIAPNIEDGFSSNLWMSAWTNLYSLDLILNTKWKFISEREIISEDIYSLLELYKYVTKVTILSEALYFYCENGTSLTHTYREDRFEKIKLFYDKCQLVCEKLFYSNRVKKRLSYPYVSNTIGALKMIVESDCKNKKEVFKNIILDNHLQNVLQKMNYKRESINRKILLTCMRKKWINVVYLLITLKCKKRGRL